MAELGPRKRDTSRHKLLMVTKTSGTIRTTLPEQGSSAVALLGLPRRAESVARPALPHNDHTGFGRHIHGTSAERASGNGQSEDDSFLMFPEMKGRPPLHQHCNC
jgi:hypothetical protein